MLLADFIAALECVLATARVNAYVGGTYPPVTIRDVETIRAALVDECDQVRRRLLLDQGTRL